jgi:dTDP-4-dehydrorhamnose reductase
MVIGAAGMLGHTVEKYFQDQNFDVISTRRGKDIRHTNNTQTFDILTSDVRDLFENPCDYYINCAGSIKQKISEENKDDILVNSVFPWQLADMCEKFGSRLIHITTDCVFSGQKGKYTEEDVHDCLDFYGKTKSLGEPTNAMVIRMSIIGEELSGKVSLVEWVKSNAGKSVKGFINHFWNGVTTLQYAKICQAIVENDYYQNDKFHIFSPNDVSKYDLLGLINERFRLGIDIHPFETMDIVDRTLRSSKTLTSMLEVPPIERQIVEM